MKTLLALPLLLATSLRADTYFTPVATARLQDRAFTTTTTVQNPDARELECQASYSRPEGDRIHTLRATYTVRPGETNVEEATLMEAGAFGTVRFDCSHPAVIVARIQTSNDGGKTFDQGRVFPAVGDQKPIAADTTTHVEAKTDLLLMEVAGHPAQVRVKVMTHDRRPIGEKTYDIPPFAHTIVNLSTIHRSESSPLVELSVSGEGAVVISHDSRDQTLRAMVRTKAEAIAAITPPSTPAVAPTPIDNLLSARFKASPFRDPFTGLINMRDRWYNPATGSFMSPDPEGNRDSANLYSYCGGDPVNCSDPTGQYEEDVHRHLTVFLALKVGFSMAAAMRIGAETEALDLDARDAMYGGGANHPNMESYHFVTPRRLLDMQHDALRGGALDEPRLRAMGEFLHAWEDSYSHQANDTRRDFTQQFHDRNPLTGEDIGHGRHRHAPDWTWGKRRNLSMTMAESTYKQLLALCQTHRDQCNGPRETFATFRNQVQEFVAYRPQIYDDVYQAGKISITVPDVVSYEEKVRILGLTTAGTPEAANRRRRVQEAEKRRKQQQ